jgi:predicted Zn-dependent protease
MGTKSATDSDIEELADLTERAEKKLKIENKKINEISAWES